MERTILHPDQRLFPLFQEGILQGDGDGGVYIQGENIFYCHEMKYFFFVAGKAKLDHLRVAAGQERLPHHLPHAGLHQGGEDLSQEGGGAQGVVLSPQGQYGDQSVMFVKL